MTIQPSLKYVVTTRSMVVTIAFRLKKNRGEINHKRPIRMGRSKTDFHQSIVSRQKSSLNCILLQFRKPITCTVLLREFWSNIISLAHNPDQQSLIKVSFTLSSSSSKKKNMKCRIDSLLSSASDIDIFSTTTPVEVTFVLIIVYEETRREHHR